MSPENSYSLKRFGLKALLLALFSVAQ